MHTNHKTTKLSSFVTRKRRRIVIVILVYIMFNLNAKLLYGIKQT